MWGRAESWRNAYTRVIILIGGGVATRIKFVLFRAVRDRAVHSRISSKIGTFLSVFYLGALTFFLLRFVPSFYPPIDETQNPPVKLTCNSEAEKKLPVK